MKTKMINLVILFVLFLQILTHKGPKNNTNSEYKTFLVKTQLTKEELISLLQHAEEQPTNLMENNATSENEKIEPGYTVEEVNKTLDDDDTLEEQIEKEIQEDALHPLDEFHVKEVKTSEVKSFVVKPEAKAFDSLYEKRFGKIYAYLTLIVFVFVFIYNKDSLFNKKRSQDKVNYRSLFDYDNSKEYMLVKTK